MAQTFEIAFQDPKVIEGAPGEFSLQLVNGEEYQLVPHLHPDTGAHIGVNWVYDEEGVTAGAGAVDVSGQGLVTTLSVGSQEFTVKAYNSATDELIAAASIQTTVGYSAVNLQVTNCARFDVIGHKEPEHPTGPTVDDNIIATMGAVVTPVTSVRFPDELHVSAGANITYYQGFMENVTNGVKIAIAGDAAFAQRVRNGARVDIDGAQIHVGDLVISNGEQIDVQPAWLIDVTAGSQVTMDAYKQEPYAELVYNGANIDLDTSVKIDADIVVSEGSEVTVVGRMAEDLVISAGNRVYEFRGKEVYRGDVKVSIGTPVTLLGRAASGSVEPTAVMCCMFDASLRADYDFVSGQSNEIVKIPFDSSVRLGVKLYSCDNKRVDVASAIQYATISLLNATVNGDLEIPATIDAGHNTIYIILERSTQSLLKRGMVYDMQVRTVDMNNNASIVLQRKLRFL